MFEPFYGHQELLDLGLAGVGEGVKVHRSVVFFRPEAIHIGDATRIDAQAVLSAGTLGIRIGHHCHLSAGVFLFGSGGSISIGDFCALSARCTVFTANDDYKDGWMVNPTVGDRYRKVEAASVAFGDHVVVGAGTVVLPGVRMERGSAAGALSLIKHPVASGVLVAGTPAKAVGRRGDRYNALEDQWKAEHAALNGGAAC
jgi:galactoside O-acetyltransferase